jgi:hypothetical protein
MPMLPPAPPRFDHYRLPPRSVIFARGGEMISVAAGRGGTMSVSAARILDRRR